MLRLPSLRGLLVRAAAAAHPRPLSTTAVARVAASSSGSSSGGDLVLVERAHHGRLATITLNDPSSLNALTVDMGDAFEAVTAELARDEELRAVVLTGKGRAFSAGGDLSFLDARCQDSPQNNSQEMMRFYRRFLSIRNIPVPIIAAINGPAIGAGLCLAAACDMRVAADDAKMGWTFASLGLHPGMAATHFTEKILGSQLASYFLMTGEVIDGLEAARLGLVLRAIPRADVVKSANALADKICAQSPKAVQAVTLTLRAQQNRGLEQTLRREADAQGGSYATDDIREGIAAIREKRKPSFK